MKNIKLEEIVASLPVLDEEAQRRILGGTSSTPNGTPPNPNDEDPFAIPGVTPPCPTTNPSDGGGGTTGDAPTEPTTSDTEGDPINPYDNPDLPSSTDVPDSEPDDENPDLSETDTPEDAIVGDTSPESTTDTATPDDSTETTTAPSTSGEGQTDFEGLYSGVLGFYQVSTGEDISGYVLDPSQSIEEQMVAMFYEAQKQYENDQNEKYPPTYPVSTGVGIAGAAGLGGLFGFVAAGFSAVSAGRRAFGEWIDNGGFSRISDGVNDLQTTMSVGLMMGIAYLFGSDTAKPWGVPEASAPTYSTETGEPFREVNQQSNENYYQNGGKNGHNFIWWLMTGVGMAAEVSQCTDTVTPDE